MPSRILVIDDDERLLDLTRNVLEVLNYEVHTSANPHQGLQTLYNTNPDLVLLDVMMPDMDGWQVCRRIREISSVPIIMLTGLNSEEDITRGLELGADSYIVKPIAASELMARVEAVLRRAKISGRQADMTKTLTFNGFSIDIENHEATYNATPIQLTPTEFKLLVCFAKGRGHILSHEYILDYVWGVGYEGNRDLLRLYVKKLRSKLAAVAGADDLIQAHWGIGYRFE